MPARAAFILLAATGCAAAQAPVPIQPLAQQVRRLEDAMNYLGQPFPRPDHAAINAAIANTDESAAVAELEKILDRYALAIVDINAESRVKVDPGPAKPELVEGGTRLFLVKVLNRANVTAPLRVQSPNSGNVYIQSTGNPEPKLELTPQNAADRWAEISIYDKPPMDRRLSGLALDYRILQVYSRDRGQRSAQIGFNVGQGSQDIGFRNDILVLFNALPARAIKLRVRDEKGQPAMASFVIRDRLNRLYPNPSKRLAPDFFFQPQIYRGDGESISLPPGYYNITYTGGPEYRAHTKEFAVDDKSPAELAFQLDRWIDPAQFGWYSGDHHVHAAGCSHYQNPTEGVLPQDMIRQTSGERLNIASVLTWGPDYYYQKQFFSGHDDPLSKPDELMHYDLEVSGFPSSHSGHIVLLGLREQDYPGATRISEWPTWDLPIFRWAKSQGAVVGFAHSGWGLEVMSDDLPNYEMPGFDGIGANEYIVDVTEPGLVDFISSVDTPYVWELSIWYHTLNVGFRTRIAGETDFPCIYDQRVGIGRTYTKLDDLSYANWLQALKDGRSYVSDGKSHLMDFKLDDTLVGTGASEVRLGAPGSVHAQVKVAAYLDALPDQSIRGKRYNEKPYWDVERARVGDTREVPVELVVNGQAVARKNVLADGQVHDVAFDVAIERSSWVAARILPAAHTNPIFVLVGGKPVRASRRSAEWCLAAVSQCWTQKAPRISVAELGAARQAYDRAREVYTRLIRESE
ncbi:MAG TPA: CehA/McbA family metallohydrolase [Bryobacteraceae bacterium]|nr:CehA/McbA family metallohydrolase [Bryobacteraceae bacterium]